MNLRSLTIKGLVWTFLEKFGALGINFLVSLFLARLLEPRDFGVVGLVTVFILIMNAVTDGGFVQALVRHPSPDEDHFSSVFLANIAVSILLFGILFIAAPVVASFYNLPELVPLIRVLGLSPVINSFSLVQGAKLTRALDFKTFLFLKLPALLTGGVLGIVLAALDYGVWSLVAQQIATAVIGGASMWLRSSWRPSLVMNVVKLKELFGFGGKMMASSLIDVTFNNIYPLIIGKFYAPAQVGFYQRANSTKQLPVGVLTSALERVTFPVLASIQNDNVKLKSAYRKILRQVLFIVTPILVGAMILATPMFRFIFTEKWLPAVPYFQWLCAVGISYPLHAYNFNLLKVKGRSDLFLKLATLNQATVVIGLLFVIPYGVMGLVIFQAIISWVMLTVNSFYSGVLINYRLKEQLTDVLPTFVISAVSASVIFGVDYLLLDQRDLIRLAAGTAAGMLTYVGISKYLNSGVYSDFVQIVTVDLLKK